MSDSKETKKSISTFWRIFPGIVFLAALFVMVVSVYSGNDDENNSSESRYLTAKQIMSELLTEVANVKHVKKWRKLADEFFQIYTKKMQGDKSAASLFLSAESTEILANYTLNPSDYHLAIERYEELALKYRKSALADDALFRSASIRLEQFKDIHAALELLKRVSTQYKRGDMSARALDLEKNLNSGVIPPNIRKSDNVSGFMNIAPYMAKIISNNSVKQTRQNFSSDMESHKAEKNEKNVAKLTKISWDSKSETQVEIIIELNKAVNWESILQRSKFSINKLDRIALQLDNVVAIPQVATGALVQGSLLTKIGIHKLATNSTKVYFDFRKVKGYEIKIIEEPYKLIILVDATKGFKNKGIEQNSKQAKNLDIAQLNDKKKDVPPKNMDDLEDINKRKGLNLAEQLGLGVRSIFIDAGHGGKDPGAMGNNIVESKITLDVAKRLGKILENNGFKVHYSRLKDLSISLSFRSEKANEVKADLFISIHVNANTDSRVSGFETYYLDFATTKRAAMVATLENATSDRTLGQLQTVMASIMLNEKKHESIRISKDIKKVALSEIIDKGYDIKDGGLKSAPFHVLIGAFMPSVLVEIGYCTNNNDARKIANPRYRQAVAEGIANGIIRYNTRLKTQKP